MIYTFCGILEYEEVKLLQRSNSRREERLKRVRTKNFQKKEEDVEVKWSQYTIMHHSIPLYTTVYHSILLYTIVYHSIPMYTTVYHSILLYTTVYHSIPMYTTVYHSIPMYTTVYHSIYIVYYSISQDILHLSPGGVCKELCTGKTGGCRAASHKKGFYLPGIFHYLPH